MKNPGPITEEEESRSAGFAPAEEDALPHRDTLTDIWPKPGHVRDKTALQMVRGEDWVR